MIGLKDISVEDEDFLVSKIRVSTVMIRVEAERVEFDQIEPVKFCYVANSAESYISNTNENIKKSVFGYYMENIHSKAQQYENTFGIVLPKKPKSDEILAMLNPVVLYIDLKSENEVFGISYECYWDSEHGFGMKISDGNIISVGGAEVSF